MRYEKAIFLLVAIALLAVTLTFAIATDSAVIGTLFIASMLILLGYYLLRFGNLGVFRIEALSAKAEFIQQKASEAESLVTDIESVRDRVVELEQEVAKARELAAPPTLGFDGATITKDGDGFIVQVRVKRSKEEPIGQIVFGAFTAEGSPAKVTKFRAAKCVGVNVVSNVKWDNIPEAKGIAISPMNPTAPLAFDVSVSGPTDLHFQGNHGFKSVIIRVEKPGEAPVPEPDDSPTT